MAIEFTQDLATFHGVIGVEDAETLLEWLQNRPRAKVDLSACTHLHPANLQVLMAAKTAVGAWPTDPGLAAWLKPALEI
ncbi:hypothetical protein SAMN02949497_4826 [Methylomagnum ishizawai]|uniref:STAS domain-containing protein n=1 Tax=Methylomagnum ishizawai TaxID=1760988 RepID=A0A1Y6D5G3_9GAMM|nr:hypothetical protein [Methylomagnum ishizawai]SMF97815.1 hypothetical protein SAMN02949497_4784 [Methylomagnum ishizawai]SMF97851.1 hypothetical protein SAMN02949497_4826 [Methylomagnum ishizawai]